MNVNLIAVPIKYGCDRDGAQHGPNKLRELNMIDIFKGNKDIYDMGDLFIPQISDKDKFKWHDNMKYLYPIRDINTNLAHAVYCSLQSNCFPFIIGGDHSLAIGSIAGASKYFKDMAVIWIDAHGDMNDFTSSPSGNIHGMPLAASIGIGHYGLTNLYHKGPKISPNNVYLLGARDLDPGEKILIEESGLNLYGMKEINEKGLDIVLSEIIEKIKASSVDGVHLSFDIDSLDSSLVPGTGTPVIGGFDLSQTKLIFKRLLNEKFITSMDLVELNPLLDDSEESTAKLCIDLIDYISKLL